MKYNFLLIKIIFFIFFLFNIFTNIVQASNNVFIVMKVNNEIITNITEFYNLIYQYQNDCLVAAIEYNKNYYEDNDLKPSENIFFSLTLKPFGTTTAPSLK